MNEKRIARIEEEIKREMSRIIAFDLKDPRVSPLASIIEVKVTNDLDQAKVYFSILGDDKVKRETMEGLNSAKKFIKKILGEKLNLWRMPEFTFILDETIEKAIHLEK